MSGKIYYTMGEVAEMFDVRPSLLRHWEREFDVLRPKRNNKGNRLYRPEDIGHLKQIYHLVKEQGMTLDGAKRALRRRRGLPEADRDAELLERLLRVRTMLAEVREELKAGEGVQIVESAVSGDVEEPSEVTVETIADSAAAEENVAESSGGVEQPMKRARRRRKSEGENKELFPFYEQSLF